MPTPTDDCVQTLDAGGVNGSLSSDCLSDKTPDDGNAQLGTRYARFYTFTLEVPADVTISLTSTDIDDTYPYLLAGAGRNGDVLHRNGDVLHKNDDIDTNSGNYHSRIAQRLQASSYTIEATTYDPETVGGFTLTLNIAASQ